MLVTSRVHAEVLLAKDHEFKSLVSIHAADESRLGAFGESTFRCRGFDSFTGPKLDLGFDDAETDGAPHAPTIGHVQSAVDFARRHPYEIRKGLIHCAAGMSRSPAIAIVMLLGTGLVPVDCAVMTVQGKSTDPQIWPNLLVLKHAEAILGIRDIVSETMRVVGRANGLPDRQAH